MVVSMRLPASFGFTSLFIGLFVLGCARTSAPLDAARTTLPAEPNTPTRSTTSASPPPFDSRWVDEVRSVVATYGSWGRVDDEMRWAPYKCDLPRPASARWSASEHADTHGQKLYTLYALDPEGYGAPPSYAIHLEGYEAPPSAEREPAQRPVLSQVIVKEAFAPEPLHDDGKIGWHHDGMGEHHLLPAEKDGRRFIAGERKGLYIMMKTDSATEGTDAGWVYATVDSDMTTVTAVGVIESCADCHAQAGDDRLFGLPG
jgi:hypothetical protein